MSFHNSGKVSDAKHIFNPILREQNGIGDNSETQLEAKQNSPSWTLEKFGILDVCE